MRGYKYIIFNYKDKKIIGSSKIFEDKKECEKQADSAFSEVSYSNFKFNLTFQPVCEIKEVEFEYEPLTDEEVLDWVRKNIHFRDGYYRNEADWGYDEGEINLRITRSDGDKEFFERLKAWANKQ